MPPACLHCERPAGRGECAQTVPGFAKGWPGSPNQHSGAGESFAAEAFECRPFPFWTVDPIKRPVQNNSTEFTEAHI